MAETDLYTKPQTLAPQIPQNPYKFYAYFLYKAIIVSIFLVVVPLFPSQPPDFGNQTLHTGSWELLQLLFVGIAVSYGLFSKRSNETEKDYGSKFDNAQFYMSRLLQVSPVFDDETENPPEPDDGKDQTWNSQHYRGEPMVVVTQESSVLEEQSGNNPQLVGKSLLLPVRSLKTPSVVVPTNESSVHTKSLRRSNSKLGSRRSSGNSSQSPNREFLGVSPEDMEEKLAETVVLRSPIPWRSRSGRMEVKKDDLDGPPLYTLPPSMEDSELNRVESRSFRFQSFSSSRTTSTSPAPNKLSTSPSLSSEMQAKNVEDFLRKKTSHKSSIPPPPPPPPPFLHKSPLRKSNYRLENDEVLSEREMRQIVRNATNGLNGNEGDEFLSRGTLLTGKSVRTTKGRYFNEGLKISKDEKWSNENVAALTRKRGQADKFFLEASPAMSKQNFSEYPNEEKERFVEKVVVETYNDSESEYDEDDEFEELPNHHQETALKNANDMGPDVDKKADEFIAKFREQIRLQRIASIRRSAGQIPKTSVR